jgi:hypothetical protein
MYNYILPDYLNVHTDQCICPKATGILSFLPYTPDELYVTCDTLNFG